MAEPIDNPDIHLQRLLQPEKPWYQSFVQNIKDAINPPKLPPLEVTSKPVPVEEMWGAYAGNETKAGLSSLAIHVGVIALLLFLGSLKPVQKAMSKVVDLVAPDLSIYKPAPNKPQGGGGGGARAPLEASKGKLPKIAPKQFTPPRVDPLPDPKLPMVPTIVADTPIPNINALNYGDPMSRLGIPSNGSGMGGGIGSGSGGGVYKIGGGVSQPRLVSKVEPEYSEEARKAKWQGTVVLSLVVDDKGQPQQIKVAKSLGLGLDQKAIEAVEKWRFEPGKKDGKAVAVYATIEVNFRLL